jgi:CCR4-NOT transcription complex subunit 9
VKNENSDVISYLLGTEIVPLCLRIMEIGNELSKTVSIFIIQKIILDNYGLSYICQTEQRLNALLDHFESILYLPSEPGKATRILKHTIRCYLRLTEDERGLKVLQKRCPEDILHDGIIEHIKDDSTTIKFIQEIRNRL